MLTSSGFHTEEGRGGGGGKGDLGFPPEPTNERDRYAVAVKKAGVIVCRPPLKMCMRNT